LDFQAEYNNRARVPAHPQIIAAWERDAGHYRTARAKHSQLGLRYGDHARQTIDLFHPDEPHEDRPLVVIVHGGYWRSLHPSSFSHWATGLNSHGYSVAVLGYRLCPEVDVVDIISDVRNAAIFLHRNIGKRLVVCGHSAGGHLVSTLVATDWQTVDPNVPADLVRTGIGISGVFDLAPLIQTEMNEQLRLDEAKARAVSSAYWPIAKGARFEAWVGGDESSEFLRQSRLVAEEWASGGASTRYELIASANHFTAPNGLADPASPIVAALVALAAATKA
jgi:arylformamidase